MPDYEDTAAQQKAAGLDAHVKDIRVPHDFAEYLGPHNTSWEGDTFTLPDGRVVPMDADLLNG